MYGSQKCCSEFLNPDKLCGLDVAILGEDVTAKYIGPIMEQSNRNFKARFPGSDFVVRDEEELRKLKEKIRRASCCAYRPNRH